jgi:hypothetical protein
VSAGLLFPNKGVLDWDIVVALLREYLGIECLDWEKIQRILRCRCNCGDRLEVSRNGIVIISKEGEIIFSQHVS